ncbi:unnamed protein product [Caenorhabditis nigoni]
MGFPKEFKRRDPGHYGDFPFPHRLSSSVVLRSPRSLRPRSYSDHVIPSWRTPAETKGPFTSIPKHLNHRCSVDEPPAVQAPDSEGKEWIRRGAPGKHRNGDVEITGMVFHKLSAPAVSDAFTDSKNLGPKIAAGFSDVPRCASPGKL